MEHYGGGAIEIVDYDPAWPRMFQEESLRVAGELGEVVLTIEHMGSTAVPGLPSKPIIDLLVGVRSLTEARARGGERLPALGYTHVTEYESWLPNEAFFRKSVSGRWTHHVHIIEPSNPRWDDWLLFRDYLRAHPETAQEYAALKLRLARDSKDDIAAYRTGKNAFVVAVTTKARRILR